MQISHEPIPKRVERGSDRKQALKHAVKIKIEKFLPKHDEWQM